METAWGSWTYRGAGGRQEDGCQPWASGAGRGHRDKCTIFLSSERESPGGRCLRRGLTWRQEGLYFPWRKVGLWVPGGADLLGPHRQIWAPCPSSLRAQWEHTVESMPLLFPLCLIVIADIPFASLWPFPGKSLHKTIKILKCTNKNVSALISQPLHFLIHRRSLITPTILTRSLGMSASSSHLRSDFHVPSALIYLAGICHPLFYYFE